jgi:hypothetical protein
MRLETHGRIVRLASVLDTSLTGRRALFSQRTECHPRVQKNRGGLRVLRQYLGNLDRPATANSSWIADSQPLKIS